MKKIQNLFNSFLISLLMVGFFSLGIFVTNNNYGKTFFSNAEITYDNISNNLPGYVEIETSQDEGNEVGFVDNEIFLMKANSYISTIIANDEISTTVDGELKTNYYYSPDENNSEDYYYFRFQNSLSLYYNLTNKDVENGETSTNLLTQIYDSESGGYETNVITNYTETHKKGDESDAYIPNNLSFTPERLNIQFKLDTLQENITRNANTVTLNKEGCYTLVIEVNYYHTTNNGVSYANSTAKIYYTFVIFNSTTYFNETGLPHLTMSANIQQTTVSSDTYSRYYFYNYNYSTSSPSNSIANFVYDPDKYQINISYTSINQSTYNSTIVYKNNQFYQYDENGNEINQKDYFVFTNLVEKEDDNQAYLYFLDLGTYDISIQYLYKTTTKSGEQIYELPFTELQGNTQLDNKKQRLYVYGYQAVYSDYSNVDPATNQPKSVELKQYDFENGTYNQSADITNLVNEYISTAYKNNSPNGIDAKDTITMKSPASSTPYSIESIKDYALARINDNTNPLQPVSTNQTPVKFLTNTKNYASDNNYSTIYKLTSTSQDNKNIWTIINGENQKFEGFNQNTAGTYLYVVQYQYDYYMSESGTLQGAYYHYQIFFFTVTNKTPSVSVVDDQSFEEIYTSGYTNKGVYILDDSKNNIYDANVTITLSAQNYNAGSNQYYFEDENIQNLESYGIYYELFNNIENDTNNVVNNKYGIYIPNNASYSNATFTIKIISQNSTTPSIRKFTIDTSPISDIKANNVEFSSGNNYKILEQLSSYNTNQSITMSWAEKASGATTYGYVKYIPLESINYYSSQTDTSTLSSVLDFWLEYNSINPYAKVQSTLPVSYKIDIEKAKDAVWVEFPNSRQFSSYVTSSYVKSSAGLYILEVYDQAGNSNFEIFMIDNTSPVFVQKYTSPDRTLRSLMLNNISISIPETDPITGEINTTIEIEWAKNKAIYLDNLTTSNLKNIKPYAYTIDSNVAQTNLTNKLEQFFKNDEENIINVNDIPASPITEDNLDEDNTILTGINDYDGFYLIIPINDTAYIKNWNDNNFTPYSVSSLNIDFLDENNQSIDGTYKIAIRDKSNTKTTGNEQTDYTTNPSSYISFNVTSDASKMMVQYINNNGEKKVLNYSSFSHNGNLYYYNQSNGDKVYTHLPNREENGEIKDNTLTEDLTYKFSYYSPLNSDYVIELSFVPVAENGSEIDTIYIYYYPFVKTSNHATGDGNSYWYYDISEEPQSTRLVYKASEENVYEPGQVLTADIIFGQTNQPSPGKYVIVRDYVESENIDSYDYFRRTITFTVDDYNLISDYEGVSNADGSVSSLESLVGGDIILSMYSSEGYSSLEVSFPRYENGLSTGSFYTPQSSSNNNVSVSGSKLPMSLFIPKYKFTTTTERNLTGDENLKTDKYSYGVNYNDKLSYYGNAYVEKNSSNNTYDVIAEGVVIKSFATEVEANNYLNENISIREYEIKVNIEASITDNNGAKITKYYASGVDEENGYLVLYETSSNYVVDSQSKRVDYFYNQGDYVVTIFQASNLGNTDNFYQYYKFSFSILSQTPNFDLYSKDGYQLTESSSNNVYYTNTDELKIQWEIPTSQYEAQIDDKNIQIKSSPSLSFNPVVKQDGNTKYFTLDTTTLLKSANSYIDITLSFEGDQTYYQPITKRIYFDRSAPLTNLQSLMYKTESATGSTITKNYQEIYMRRYADQNNTEQNVNASTDFTTMSYSYSLSSGNFKYFAYNIDLSYFNSILALSLIDSKNNPYETQYIYYKFIPALNSYNQVDKNSFSQSNYNTLTSSGVTGLLTGYYEIVERDYAGNMTVYIVYLTESDLDDVNETNDAISYKNNNHLDENITLNSSEIVDGLNIYSNTGFTITSYNYQSDPWGFINIQLNGQSVTRYMKSPWLKNGYIYKITLSGSGILFEQVNLSSLLNNVTSSNFKHKLTFIDRLNGEYKTVYLSIMDANINAQKIEDPNKTSAILNINIPTPSEYNSTERTYVFPTKIEISQFDQTITQEDKWKTIFISNQYNFGTWTTDPNYTSSLSYISLTNINSDTILQIKVNLGVNSSTKIRYKITDNFGNETIIIQLANEVSINEISGISKIYSYNESNGDMTYLSDQDIIFSFNSLLYKVIIKNADGIDITSNLISENKGNNIYTYTFTPSGKNWDLYYKIEVYDFENNEYIKTLHIRLYYKLPYYATSLTEVVNGGIVFNDKNGQAITNFNQSASDTIYFEGIPYTTTSYSFSTYSQDITAYFRNGQSLSYTGSNNYKLEYKYSLYLSRDEGKTWECINNDNSATTGVRISGTGKYIIFAKYDDSTIFTNISQIYRFEILDTEASYYNITLDGLKVEKSNIRYVDSNGKEYGTTYLVRINHNEINHDDLIVVEGENEGIINNSRLKITLNPEQNVSCILQECISEANDAFVDVFYYTATNDNQITSRGDFAIIYIKESNDFVSLLTYETSIGTQESIKSSSQVIIFANKTTDSNYEKTKISFTSTNGIDANKINIEVLKLFNGTYVQIYPTVYTSGELSYVYLERSGSYKIKLYDSCTPANVQSFKNGDYLDIIFINSVPFLVSHEETTVVDGETVTNTITTEKIQNAVYNSSVKISLYNLSTYYQPGGYPTITVLRNGKEYKDYTVKNYEYTFTQAGYYSVTFSATSSTEVPIREETFNFTILNENESRYAFEYSQFSNYYITKVLKNGKDITQELVDISNFSTVTINGKKYLSEMIANFTDKKTGVGKYEITVCTNDNQYSNIISDTFTFKFWINTATPPISISVNEGESTTSDITVSFNVQNFYDTMGDCYIKVGSEIVEVSKNTLSSLGENVTISITNDGTYFVQIYSLSDYLLFSYKVVKTAPLNAFAIIAIIFGVIALGAIIGITIAIRKRQRIK